MMDRSRLKMGLVAILFLTAWGCASPPGEYRTVLPRPATYQPSAFAHRAVSQDVELYWNCARPQPALVRLDGIAKNIGRGEVHLLEIELHDVDRQTGNILQSGAAVSDLILHPDIFSAVQVEVQPATASGQIDLLYTYQITSIDILKTSNIDKQFEAHDICAGPQYPNAGSP